MNWKQVTLCINGDTFDGSFEKIGKISDITHILISNDRNNGFVPFPHEIHIRREDISKFIDILQKINEKLNE